MKEFGIKFSGEEKMDEESKILDNLILQGAVEVSGMDMETGEMLYNFTDKLADVMPDLYNEHMNSVNSEIMYFWQHGFLSMNDITEKNPIIRLTNKAFDNVEILKLPKNRLSSLNEIKRILKVI
jgi:hypothetical protein